MIFDCWTCGTEVQSNDFTLCGDCQFKFSKSGIQAEPGSDTATLINPSTTSSASMGPEIKTLRSKISYLHGRLHVMESDIVEIREALGSSRIAATDLNEGKEEDE